MGSYTAFAILLIILNSALAGICWFAVFCARKGHGWLATLIIAGTFFLAIGSAAGAADALTTRPNERLKDVPQWAFGLAFSIAFAIWIAALLASIQASLPRDHRTRLRRRRQHSWLVGVLPTLAGWHFVRAGFHPALRYAGAVLLAVGLVSVLSGLAQRGWGRRGSAHTVPAKDLAAQPRRLVSDLLLAVTMMMSGVAILMFATEMLHFSKGDHVVQALAAGLGGGGLLLIVAMWLELQHTWQARSTSVSPTSV